MTAGEPLGVVQRYGVAPSVSARASSLGELLGEAMIQHKSLVAMVEADRKREASRWTYAEAEHTALRIARKLEEAGVGGDDRVAILMTNQPSWLLTAIAVFRRGAVLVPLDYKLELHDQRALIAHSRPAVLVVEWPIWRKLGPVDVKQIWVTEAPRDADLEGALRWEDLPDSLGTEVKRHHDDLATIVYSSGTGGHIKGCILTHGSYLAQLRGLLERFPMQPGDVYFSVLPTNHAIDFMVGFIGPFVCGATVVHQRTLRPEMLRFTMSRYGVTHMAVVPMLLSAFERAIRDRINELPGWQRAVIDSAIELHRTLTETGPNHALARRLLAPIHSAFGGRLRLLICGGAPTDKRLVEFFAAVGLPVVVGYGLTEACTAVTVCAVHPLRSDTVGLPLRDVMVQIVDPRPDGVGEVRVSGPTLMRGYLDDPELTASVLRDGWLYTGDLGFVDASGHLHLVGRIKDMIVTAGGKNVYPEDVAFAFSDLGEVEEVAVVTANALWPEPIGGGSGGETLVLVIRSERASDLLLPEVVARNRALPAYKRISSVLWWKRAFPRTASMKLKRSVLISEIASTSQREDLLRLGGVA